jgi:hypothetical protein
LLCKKITVAKSKEVKTGCSLAESSEEGYCSKRTVLQMAIIQKNFLSEFIFLDLTIFAVLSVFSLVSSLNISSDTGNTCYGEL